MDEYARFVAEYIDDERDDDLVRPSWWARLPQHHLEFHWEGDMPIGPMLSDNSWLWANGSTIRRTLFPSPREIVLIGLNLPRGVAT